MSNTEAKRKQNYEKQQAVFRKYNKFMKTRKYSKNNNTNLNNEPAYPVNISAININVGNSRPSRASSAANMYNLIDRSRHKAMWNNVLKRSRKSGKQHGGHLSEKIIRANPHFQQLPRNLQNAIIAGYREAKAKGVASSNEFDTIIHLAFIKAGIPTGVQMNRQNQ